MKHLKRYLLAFFLLPIALGSVAQTTSLPDAMVMSGDVFGTRNFIENKGQFRNPVGTDSVLFIYEYGVERILFTSKGIIHEIPESPPPEKEETAENEEEEIREFFKRKNIYVQVKWAGALEARVMPGMKQAHYFTYGSEKYNSSAYKKITYEQIYPGIDLVFTIPENKVVGIEYSLMIRPGADYKKFHAVYSGALKKLSLDNNGNLHVRTKVRDIIEFAPGAFFAEEKKEIQCKFELSGKSVRFQIEGMALAEQALVIDPWVTSVTTLTNNNCVYDVDFDYNNNLYAYGGGTAPNIPMKVAKYNSIGQLVWTFGGVVVIPTWSATGGWRAGVAVNKGTQKVFVTARLNAGSNLVRLNAAGNYDNFQSIGTPQLSGEVGDIDFECTGDIIVFGGNNGSCDQISASTGSVLLHSTFFPALNNACCQDVVSFAEDIVGNHFAVFGTPAAIGNSIALISPGYTNNIWLAPTGYNIWSGSNNSNAIGGGNGITGNQNRALAVNMSYLYYYNGLDIAAYSKLNGTMVASTNVPGHTIKQQSGIAVDDCNNVYIGGNGSILCYHFNGIGFSTLTPIALNTTVTNKYVVDILYDKFTKKLFVGGTGFLGEYSAAYSQTCAAQGNSVQCNFGMFGANITSYSITCANLGSATLTPQGGIGPYFYQWLPTNQSSSVATGLAPGTYTYFVTDFGTSIGFSNTVTFVSLIPLTGTVNYSSNLPCFSSSNGTAAVVNLAGGSGNQNYLWSNGTTTYTTGSVNGLIGGVWTVTVTDALTGCSITPVFTISTPPQLSSYIIPMSSQTICPNGTVSLMGITGGGIPGAYTYSWSQGGAAANTCVVTETAGGVYVYTLTSWDQVNCSVTAIADITVIPTPPISVPDAYICLYQTGTLNISGATNYTWSTGSNSTSITATPSVNTQFTVFAEAQSCTTMATPFIYIKPNPAPQFISNSPVCNGQLLQLDVSANTSYTWNGPGGFLSYNRNPFVNPAAPNNAGVYDVTVTAPNSCTGSTSGTVVVNPTPTLAAIGASICVNQTLNLTATSFTGSTFVWTGPNGFYSALQNPVLPTPPVSASGNYSVKATSAAGCTNMAMVQVSITALPLPYFTSNGPKCMGENLNFSVNGALSYQWFGPNNFNSILQFPFINNAPLAAGGIYTVNATTGPCTVIHTLNVVVYALPTPSISSNMPVCETKQLILSVNNTSIASIQWLGPNNYSNTSAYAIVNPAGILHSGIYSVAVIDVHGCKNSSSVSVTILENPVLTTFSAKVCYKEPATIKAEGADTYFWWGPNGYTAYLDRALISSAKNVSTDTYSVMGTGLNGCTTIATAVVETIPLPVPKLNASPSLTRCLNEEVNFTGYGGKAYEWTGPGQFYYSGEVLTLKLSSQAMSGIYTLTAFDENGCKDYTSAIVGILPLPVAAVEIEREEACAPFCSDITLLASAQIRPTWNIGAISYSGNTLRHCFPVPGIYAIELSINDTTSQCNSAMRYYVKARPQPVAEFSYLPEKPLENGDEVQFTNLSQGEGIHKWTWHFDAGIEGQFEKKTEHATFLYKNAGFFPIALVVENRYGCRDTVIKSIRVEEDFTLFIPDVFTPNGDGLNEVFMPVGRGVRQYQLTLFDRWGHVLFESSDLKNGWDGIFKNDPAPVGTYNWRIQITSQRGESKALNGHVLLKR